MSKSSDEQYSEHETERRREAALKRMLSTPHKPHKPIGERGTVGKGKKGKAQPSGRA